jgi:Cu-Zn family superoxide dismutase
MVRRFVLAGAIGTVACGGSLEPTVVAEATVEARSGSTVTGSLLFVADGDHAAQLTIEIRNAPPGIHAMHLHETGDCTDPAGASAGGHWNPEMHMHGDFGAADSHLGDLGNITVEADGTGRKVVTNHWAIGTGEANDVVGKAFIFHANVDEFVQPTGNAGGRLGCGVVSVRD